MERQYKNIDKVTQNLIKDAGLQKPSHDFTSRVMEVVNAGVAQKVYQPLISKRAWFVLVAVFVGSLLWISYSSTGLDLTFIDKLDLSNKLTVKNPFEGIEIPRSVIYSVGFMSLFLLQIPFLKRLIEQRYE